MRTIVALGASSAIVISTLKCFARDGDTVFLVGRSIEKLDATKKDLIARGSLSVHTIVSDLASRESFDFVYKEVFSKTSVVDILYIGYGTLSDQERAEKDIDCVLSEINSNFSSIVGHITKWSAYFVERKEGTIAVISSVAGERGRQSNYIYGSSKAGLSAFLSGLRNRLSKFGIAVLTIKPGFVDTPMTEGKKKGPLFATSDSVGECIYNAILSKKDILYVPWFWRIIMSIICAVPEKIFKKLSL